MAAARGDVFALCGNPGVHMRQAIVKHIVVVVVLAAGAGCDNGRCAGGSVGTVIVGKDAFVIEGFDQGVLAGGYSEDQVFPYADGSPFLTCRSVGSLVVRERIDGIDGDRDFPELEELGSIFVDFPDGDQGVENRVVPLVSGFDQLLRLGSISGVVGLQDGASIGEISGFNSISTVDTFDSTADVTGFTALAVVEGDFDVGRIRGPLGIRSVGGSLDLGGLFEGEFELASLEEIGGDLIIDSTRLTSVAFPALVRVGGSVEIVSNPLQRWEGAALGARIGGDFLARANAPMTNDDFAERIADLQLQIEGSIKICQNGDPREPGDTCNEI